MMPRFEDVKVGRANAPKPLWLAVRAASPEFG